MPEIQLKSTKQNIKPKFFSYENLRSLGNLIVILFAIHWSVISTYVVPTGSMEPSIKVRDRLIANKLSYGIRIPFTDKYILRWAFPKKGDIVVIRSPESFYIPFVKRVIGTSGDKIIIKEDILYINGVKQDIKFVSDKKEKYNVVSDIQDSVYDKDLYEENLNSVKHWIMLRKPEHKSEFDFVKKEFTVPKNSVFVMGDNRYNSVDSRIFGSIPLNYVRGKAFLVLWSFIWKTDEQRYVLDLEKNDKKFIPRWNRILKILK